MVCGELLAKLLWWRNARLFVFLMALGAMLMSSHGGKIWAGSLGELVDIIRNLIVPRT